MNPQTANKITLIRKSVESVVNKPYQTVTATGIYERCPAGQYIIFTCDDNVKRYIDGDKLWKAGGKPYTNILLEVLWEVYPKVEDLTFTQYKEYASMMSDSDCLLFINKFKNRWVEWN